MRKLAVPAIILLALALLTATIGYVVSAKVPAAVNVPASISGPTTMPAPTQETIAARPTPTLFPAPALPSAIEQEPIGDNVIAHEGEQPPYALTAAGYDMVQLVNNGTAADLTWQQLVSFLTADKTDENDYVSGSFMCGAFAQELHNNAEAAGIRAAWVSVYFEGKSKGHALNAFYTTDRGLVYIDSIGKTAQDNTGSDGTISTSLEGLEVYGKAGSYDKVAYVDVGKELGFVSLNVASCPQYGCYEDYVQRKVSFVASLNEYNQETQDYNSEVAAFNEWIAGEVSIEGTSDAARAHQWSEELGQEKDRLTALSETLDTEGESLGAFWQPLGTVSEVNIYW